MACLLSKYGRNSKNYVEGWKYTHPSKKHYRPQHVRLNKRIERFDNDGISAHIELDDKTDISIETGINKDRWKFCDHDYNDEMKDGNNRY